MNVHLYHVVYQPFSYDIEGFQSLVSLKYYSEGAPEPSGGFGPGGRGPGGRGPTGPVAPRNGGFTENPVDSIPRIVVKFCSKNNK